MNDWIELKDLQAVAKAQADGWEILEYDLDWVPWPGNKWLSYAKYQGRPKPKRKVIRVRMAVMELDGEKWLTELEEASEHRNEMFFAWVKGSEWREVEYE